MRCCQASGCGIGQATAHREPGDQRWALGLPPDKTADAHRIAGHKIRVGLAAQQAHPFREASLFGGQNKGQFRWIGQTLGAVAGQIAERGARRKDQHQRSHHATEQPGQAPAFGLLLSFQQKGHAQHQQDQAGDPHQAMEDPAKQQIEASAVEAPQQRQAPEQQQGSALQHNRPLTAATG